MVDLKKIRNEKSMTQQQLADQIHCTRTVIANIECGNSQPSISTAKSIASVLGFDWWQFFDGGDEIGNDSLYSSGSGQATEN